MNAKKLFYKFFAAISIGWGIIGSTYILLNYRFPEELKQEYGETLPEFLQGTWNALAPNLELILVVIFLIFYLNFLKDIWNDKY